MHCLLQLVKKYLVGRKLNTTRCLLTFTRLECPLTIWSFTVHVFGIFVGCYFYFFHDQRMNLNFFFFNCNVAAPTIDITAKKPELPSTTFCYEFGINFSAVCIGCLPFAYFKGHIHLFNSSNELLIESIIVFIILFSFLLFGKGSMKFSC